VCRHCCAAVVFDVVSCTLCAVELGCATVQGMKLCLSTDSGSEFGRCLAQFIGCRGEGHDVS